MSKLPMIGRSGDSPALRFEAHFGDRLVRCFPHRPASIDAMFLRSVDRHGSREAIVDGSSSLSYAELAGRVNGAAASLKGHGIGSGDRVGMLIGNRADFVIVLLAVQRLRAIAVPIGIREQAPGISYVLGHCGARILVHDGELTPRLPLPESLPEPVAFLSLDGDRWRQLAEPVSDGAPGGDALAAIAGESVGHSEEETAVILYTSGTTGRPKGAMLSHFNLIHSALHYEYCMQLTCEDRSAVVVPMSHVTGLVAMVMAMLNVGGALIVFSHFKARSFLGQAAALRITHTILVPAMYQLCLLEPAIEQVGLDAWRVGAYGGAAMPRTTIEALAQKLPRLTLMNAYGATETTSPATIMPAGLQADHLTSVGRPVPAADIRVMDDWGCELPTGTGGELWIAGPMVVAGYWNDPAATAASFIGGYWKSGDIGSIDEEGFVSVFDRRKDMLNRGGYKIYSVEVENCLLGAFGVLEAAVIGRPCPVLGERVHAVVSVSEACAADKVACEERLRAYCAANLADYKVPETWVIQTDPLPRNANGKLMKRDLRPA